MGNDLPVGQPRTARIPSVAVGRPRRRCWQCKIGRPRQSVLTKEQFPSGDFLTQLNLSWHSPLLPFQVDGVKALLTFRHLLLADDMGLGKTIQAIAALRILVKRGEIASCLIVAPTSLLAQWRYELARWAPELRVSIIRGGPDKRIHLWNSGTPVKLVGYETMRNDVMVRIPYPAKDLQWDLDVLDEASRIKNAPTGASRAAKRLKATRRWALTGTPLENYREDVLSILSFLAGKTPVRTAATTEELRAILPYVQLRRKKANVLKDLPQKRIIDVPLDLGPHQYKAYIRAERDGIRRLREMGPDIPIFCILELIIRLKQICNRDPLSGESSKMADIRERVSAIANEGHRCLVFSQFTDGEYGVRRLSWELKEFDPILYTGAMRLDDRSEAIKRFTESPKNKAMIISLKAGGMGLNLQAASYVFHLDRWWNPAIEDQAESRAHRMGQQNQVTAYRYTARGTIEERIADILEAKRQLFAEVVDDVSIDLESALTKSELLNLFGL